MPDPAGIARLRTEATARAGHRVVVPVDMLRAASQQMHGREFTVRQNDAVWRLLYHLFSAMGGAMSGSQEPPAVLVVETPRR